jgi:hypothetical protein
MHCGRSMNGKGLAIPGRSTRPQSARRWTRSQASPHFREPQSQMRALARSRFLRRFNSMPQRISTSASPLVPRGNAQWDGIGRA